MLIISLYRLYRLTFSIIFRHFQNIAAMSKRHSTPHSLQFAKLLCWGTFGPLGFRLRIKILMDFHCCPVSGAKQYGQPSDEWGFTHVHPFSFKLQPMALEKFPKNLQPRVTQIQRLGCRPFGGPFWLGWHCGELEFIWKSLAVFWLHDPSVSARTEPKLRFKVSNMFVHSAGFYA